MLHSNFVTRLLTTAISLICALLAFTSCKANSANTNADAKVGAGDTIADTKAGAADIDSAKADAAANSDTEYFAVLDGRTAVYKDGIFTFENGLLSFLSFDLEKMLTVCYKPNCLHDSELCPARMPTASSVFVYGEKLYTFENEHIWTKDGKVSANSALFSSDLSGTDRRKIAELEGCLVNSGAYVKDGTAYFAASEKQFDETGGDTHYNTEYICSCDLAAGKIEKLSKIAEGCNAALRIIGCYNGRLVLEYRSGSETAELYNDIEYCYYIAESGETEAIEGSVIRAQKNELILKNGDSLEIYTPDSAEPYIITDERFVNPEWGGYAISDGRLILSAEGIAIDLESKKEYKTEVCTLIARYDSGFVVRIPGQQGYEFVSDSEFYS